MPIADVRNIKAGLSLPQLASQGKNYFEEIIAQ